MKSISLSSVTPAISTFLKRFHIILFVLIAIGGLAVAVLFLNIILVTSTQPVQSDTNDATSLDTRTVDSIKKSHTSTSQTIPPLDRSGERQSPFSE